MDAVFYVVPLSSSGDFTQTTPGAAVDPRSRPSTWPLTRCSRGSDRSRSWNRLLSVPGTARSPCTLRACRRLRAGLRWRHLTLGSSSDEPGRNYARTCQRMSSGASTL
jgi:hypothetical protein